MKHFKLIFSIVLLFVISCSLFNGNIFSYADNYQLQLGLATVISSKCDIYTDSSFSSEKIMIDDKIVTLSHDESVEILSFSGDFAEIENKNVRGYVYKYYLTQNSSQEIYPVFNGKLRRDSVIYDIELKKTDFQAKKNDKVYIYEGFNNKKEYTAVQIVLEDGTLYNGYIKTEDIKPNGISKLLITGISIIIASVTIVLSLIFIRKSKKVKSKNKHN